MIACPLCGQNSFHPSQPVVTLGDVLDRWEDQLEGGLSEATRADYAKGRGDALTLYSCAHCGFGQFDPVVTGTPNFYADISAVNYYNQEKWEFREAIAEIRRTGARTVLDVGCGSGVFLDQLREDLPGIELCGYEISAEMAERVKARGHLVLPSDPTAFDGLVRAGLQFDAITMLQVVEHVNDPIAFVRDFIPLLRPKGHLIITVPNAQGPLRLAPEALTELPPHHTTRWSRAALWHLLEAVNCPAQNILLEPLPDYLWDSYLHLLWDDPIWPAKMFDPIALQAGAVSLEERVSFGATALKQAGIRWLEGVDGHTVYVAGRKR